ncbi:MAG: arginyl-tRNA synthetase [Chloroflexi bacterium]|jgi:arginyl-tRNA synthetase|nr:MAG: arginyl-tRNA synthetase [Chloroflexota bacterium]
MSLKTDIAEAIIAGVSAAQAKGSLPAGELPPIVVDRPQSEDNGDFATNLPLRLARAFRLEPFEIAQRIAESIPTSTFIERVWAAKPGFVNFALNEAWLTGQVEAILQAKDSYGNSQVGAGRKVQVEFVSVNPTGPIHVGHTRGAVLGSTLASVLSAAGYDVTREYYVNDHGTQMELFYRSVYVRYLQAQGQDVELPAQGYKGDYITELAKLIQQEEGDRFLNMPEDEAVTDIGEIGLDKMLTNIGADLEQVGVTFDVWYKEHDLFDGGRYGEAMGLIAKNGYVSDREGARWFTSTSLGEDKDNVLVRSSGQPTYFASDVAYHLDKFAYRGFDHVIDIWGADHQGHVSRMKAVLQALGIDPNRLTVMISQMVTLRRGDEQLKISKRSGDLITLRDLVEDVGADACRYFFLSRSPESQMEFDLDLAKEQSSNNPVYYVQYGHARIASISRLAAERGIDYVDGDVSVLKHPAELALIRKMIQLPGLVESMAEDLEPHHLARYSLDLASAFHWFYQQCRVVSSEPSDLPMTKARLRLVDAARIVLARSLSLMGMAAPEQM